MSNPADFEPIEPGGGISDAVWGWLGEALVMVLGLALIYLGLAWWQGDTPSWKSVLSIAGVLGWLIASLGRDQPPNRKHEKKLRRLFRGGRIPDPDQVMSILSGTAESDFQLLTERHILGFLTREEWAHQMSVMLKLSSSSGTVAALVLLALCAVGTGARADKIAPRLEQLVDGADLIVVGEVEAIEELGGWRVGTIEVDRFLSQGGPGALRFLADKMWSCDTSGGEVGERFLFFLQQPENNLGNDHMGFGRGVPPTYVEDGPILRIAWSGSGQMRIEPDRQGERVWVGVSDAAEHGLDTRSLGKRPDTVPLEELERVVRALR